MVKAVKCLECGAECAVEIWAERGMTHNAGCPIQGALDRAGDGVTSVVVGHAPGAAVDRGSDDARPEDFEKRARPLDALNSAALDSHERRLARIEGSVMAHHGVLESVTRAAERAAMRIEAIETRLARLEAGARQDWQRDKLTPRAALMTQIMHARDCTRDANGGDCSCGLDRVTREALEARADTRAQGENHASKASDHIALTGGMTQHADGRVTTTGPTKLRRPVDVSRESIRTPRRKWWPFG